MAYQFQFEAVLASTDLLAKGVLMTVVLSAASILFGTAIGIACSAARSLGSRRTRALVELYVEVVRNTPFLVQIFILYFGLPAIGIQISATGAALLGMVVNLGAYSAEIIRAGVDSIHRSQIEAGLSLGMTRLQIFRHIIVKPAVAKVYPALCSQFTLMMLASSVTSAISTQELSSMAAQIDAESFRSLEVYIVVTLIYLALALSFKAALTLIGHCLFARRKSKAPAPPPAEVEAAANWKEVAP